MRHLVTGGTGFTGSHLVRRLLDRGDEVHVVDNQRGLFFDELEEGGARLFLGSVTDGDLVRRAAEGCHRIFHLAAAFRQLDVPDQHYWDVNVEGTRNVAEAALEVDAEKLIYCSTQGVHGHVEDPPGDETSPIAPADYYQYTKHEGEKVVLEFLEHGLDSVILRPTAIYGPGDPERFVFLFRLVKRNTFWMFGDGQTFYHPVYIDNLTDAFELAAEAEGVAGEAFLIADAEYYPIEELVKEVAKAIDEEVKIRHLPFRPLWLAAVLCEFACKPLRISPPLFRRRVDWFRQDRAFKISKAQKHLGYQPTVDLETGLRRTGEWYKEEGLI